MDSVVLNITEEEEEEVTIHISENEETVKLVIFEAAEKKTARIEWVEPYCYVGKAVYGSDESESVWVIYRIEVLANGSVVKLTATGVKWSERLTIIYD